jgi:hypothetical protein
MKFYLAGSWISNALWLGAVTVNGALPPAAGLLCAVVCAMLGASNLLGALKEPT